jgi:hypothetical protein
MSADDQKIVASIYPVGTLPAASLLFRGAFTMAQWSRLRRRKVVFSLRVDYADQQRQGRSMSSHGMIGDFPLSSLEADLRNIIERELPQELTALFDIDVQTKVLDTKYTSLTIFFGALIAAYPLIASYHDFAESVHLIKKHCYLLVDALDSSKYGHSFNKSVDVYYPTMPDPTDYPYRWMRHMFGHPGGEEAFALTAFMQRPTASHVRDLFFWYLVAMNLVLAALVGSLVYRAVVSTYYEQPTKTIIAPAPTTTAPAPRTTTH